MISPHHNQQLFSDYYLNVTLEHREDWVSLIGDYEVEVVRKKITALFKRYKPSDKEKEAQTEEEFIKPILKILGHTFAVQASLATPGKAQTPDYIFYRDQDAQEANKGKMLDESLLASKAFAIGDAKSWNRPLDSAPTTEGKERYLFTNKNPTFQIAFYIQHSGLDWGILTNGRLWRLYHKNTAHRLDRYYEVDLPELLKHGTSREFLYFYLFFRRAAFDQHTLSVSNILKESMDYAQGISDALKKQVYEALRHIAQGLLDYPSNNLSNDNATMLKEIYDNSLILLYRMLFILYAEARNLLPMNDSAVYAQNYSLRSITKAIAEDLSEGRILRSNSTRIYHNLKELFGYINLGDQPLNISSFNGGLFDPEQHSFLEQHLIADARLQQVIDRLARVDGQSIDYRDLSVRNLGTIYEGLLEYHLESIETNDGWSIDLLNEKGERKAKGSYYTPDYIVKYIVDQTLGPLLQQMVSPTPHDKTMVERMLAIKVLDPSMGSGHFLVEATEYIARFMVEQNVPPEGVTKEAELAYWKRRIVQSCIYGVDLNPLAVELAKLSLWLSTVAKGRPLSFLDHHLRTGNSLIGSRLTDLAIAPNGNGSAYKTKKTEAPKEQLSLFDDDVFRQNMTTAVDLMWLVEDSPAQTVEDVKQQEQLYATMRKGLIGKYGKIANLYTATRYGLMINAALWKPLVDFATDRIITAPAQFKDWSEQAETIASKRYFFHWELEFPEVFFDRNGQPKREQAGFDAVIGNPPWIRQEMFSEDKLALKRYSVYHGVADLYTYFVELGNTHLKNGGRFGFIVPNKFVRANYGKSLRNFLLNQVKLERLVNFGDLPVFHDAITYPMIVLTSKQPIDDAQVKYTYLQQIPADDMASAIESGETYIPRNALTDDNWPLEGAETQAIIDKMGVVSAQLGQLVDKKLYNRGILTGFNEAFVIDQQTRDKLIADDPNCVEIIKPLVMGKDIKRYKIDYQERYLIFTRHGIDLTRYEAIEQHLLPYKDQLEPKPTDWDDNVKGDWPGRKPGTYKWYEIQDSIAYYDEFEKPKIIFPDIAFRCTFAYDVEGFYSTNTTYFIPIDAEQKYLVPLLNSSLVEFFFRTKPALLRGDYLRFFTQYVTQIPIRRITFSTPADERKTLANESIALYNNGKHEELLAFTEACLAHQPEQSDVIHDLLIYLAEQMIELKRKRQEKLDEFLFDLKGTISGIELRKLTRLWTPPDTSKKGDVDAQSKLAEAEQMIGALAKRQLDLYDDIGFLNEEQWIWLLLRRLIRIYRLADVVKVFRQRQPAIATLDKRITKTDSLINAIVYRLYGLTAEEVAVVESALH